MGTISVIEFGVYGFIAYSSLLMLIISVIKEVPTTKLMSISRSIFLMPGMICAAVLASSGVNIQTSVDTTGEIIKNLNDSSTWQSNLTNTTNIVLQDPIWITVHVMIFLVLLVYVIIQILSLFTKRE